MGDDTNHNNTNIRFSQLLYITDFYYLSLNSENISPHHLPTAPGDDSREAGYNPLSKFRSKHTTVPCQPRSLRSVSDGDRRLAQTKQYTQKQYTRCDRRQRETRVSCESQQYGINYRNNWAHHLPSHFSIEILGAVTSR